MQPEVLALALAPSPSNVWPSFTRLFCTVEPAPLQPGLLMDACKYLESLQYRVWKKMLGSVESGKDTQQSAPEEWRPSCAAQTWPSFSALLSAALSRRGQGLPALTHLRKANSPFCLYNSKHSCLERPPTLGYFS